jgi:hypothetical protein
MIEEELDEAEEPGAITTWDAEVARRAAELDSGQVKAVAVDEFWRRCAMTNAKLGLDGGDI